MDLPPPVPTQERAISPNVDPVKQQGSEVNPEFLPSTQQGQQAGQGQPTPKQAQQAVASAMPHAQSTAGSQASSSSNPAVADDVDLIEKEWVEKAKAIVNHTKDDPHRQSKEINKMKADYIKKRYNKDVQVSE